MSIVFPVRVDKKHIYIQQDYYVSLGQMINDLEKDGFQVSKMAKSNGRNSVTKPQGNVSELTNKKWILCLTRP